MTASSPTPLRFGSSAVVGFSCSGNRISFLKGVPFRGFRGRIMPGISSCLSSLSDCVSSLRGFALSSIGALSRFRSVVSGTSVTRRGTRSLGTSGLRRGLSGSFGSSASSSSSSDQRPRSLSPRSSSARRCRRGRRSGSSTSSVSRLSRLWVVGWCKGGEGAVFWCRFFG